MSTNGKKKRKRNVWFGAWVYDVLVYLLWLIITASLESFLSFQAIYSLNLSQFFSQVPVTIKDLNCYYLHTNKKLHYMVLLNHLTQTKFTSSCRGLCWSLRWDWTFCMIWRARHKACSGSAASTLPTTPTATGLCLPRSLKSDGLKFSCVYS